MIDIENQILFEVNGAIVLCNNEIRLHEITNESVSKLEDTFFILNDLTIEIEPGYIVLVKYEWVGLYVALVVVSYLDFHENILNLYIDPEFYQTITYVLHRMKEALLIQ